MPADTLIRTRAGLPLIHALEPAAAAALCGVVAGAVYLPVRILFAELLTPHGALASFQRIAALLMGPDALPPEGAGFVAVSMALMIHLALSLVLGQAIAHLVDGFRARAAVAVGLAAGLDGTTWLEHTPRITLLPLIGHQREPRRISWQEQRKLLPKLPPHLGGQHKHVVFVLEKIKDDGGCWHKSLATLRLEQEATGRTRVPQ